MAVFLPLSHVQFEPSDDSWLLLVDGRPVDIAGYFSEQFADLTRNCSRIQELHIKDQLYADVLAAIQQYSFPDSASAELISLQRQDNWLLAQVRFSRLQNAVVLLSYSENGLTIPSGSVWSGTTHPHRPEPIIRRYLRIRAPDVPSDLLRCFVSQLSEKDF